MAPAQLLPPCYIISYGLHTLQPLCSAWPRFTHTRVQHLSHSLSLSLWLSVPAHPFHILPLALPSPSPDLIRFLISPRANSRCEKLVKIVDRRSIPGGHAGISSPEYLKYSWYRDSLFWELFQSSSTKICLILLHRLWLGMMKKYTVGETLDRPFNL